MSLEIIAGIAIPEDLLVFTFSRSSGPGGQNVNKVNTRATVSFDVANFEGFSVDQKQRVFARLGGRINRDGILRVSSQQYRSQNMNRDAAIDRLCDLLRSALKRVPVRKKTRVPTRAKTNRLEQKKRRGMVKHLRKKPLSHDG